MPLVPEAAAAGAAGATGIKIYAKVPAQLMPKLTVLSAVKKAAACHVTALVSQTVCCACPVNRGISPALWC